MLLPSTPGVSLQCCKSEQHIYDFHQAYILQSRLDCIHTHTSSSAEHTVDCTDECICIGGTRTRICTFLGLAAGHLDTLLFCIACICRLPSQSSKALNVSWGSSSCSMCSPQPVGMYVRQTIIFPHGNAVLHEKFD